MNLVRTIFFWVALLSLALWVFLGEGFKVHPALPSPGQLSLFLAAALLLLQPRSVGRQFADPALSLLIASVAIAFAWALVRDEPIRLIYQDAVPILAFFVTFVGLSLFPGADRRRWLVIAMVVGSVSTLKTMAAWFHGQHGIAWENPWQTYAMLGDSLGRIILRGGSVAMLAALAFWIALLSTRSAERDSVLHRLALAALPLAAVGVFFKQTRSDLVGLLALAGFLILHRVLAGKRIVTRFSATAVASLLVAILLGGTVLAARLSTSENSISFRIDEVRTLWTEQSGEAFILGGGFGQPSTGIRDVGPTLYSHNYIVALLLKWGIAGAIAFHALLLGRPRKRPPHPIEVAAAAIIVTLLAHSLFASQFASPTAPFLLGACAALRNGDEE